MRRRNLGTCFVDGCKSHATVKELCASHYNLRRRYGSFEKPPKSPGPWHVSIADDTYLMRRKIDRRIWVCFRNIQARCTWEGDSHYRNYGGKGIRNLLTMEELIYLWIRDNAAKMVQPSIDREDVKQDYSLANCRFIEMDENRRRRWA